MALEFDGLNPEKARDALTVSALNRAVSGLPGSTDTPLSWLLGNKQTSGRKKEVVVLIKPTIIRTAADWETLNRRARAALHEMDDTRARVIRMDGSVAPAAKPAK